MDQVRQHPLHGRHVVHERVERHSQLTSATNLASSTRTFYVPKDGTLDMSQTASYYRYQIPSGGADMIRAEYGTVITNNVTVQIDGGNVATGTAGDSWTTLHDG